MKFMCIAVAIFFTSATLTAQSFQKVITTNGNCGGYSIIQTSEGGYIVAGSNSVNGQFDEVPFVVKLSNAGDIEWARTYVTSWYTSPSKIIQTHDGGYLLSGAVLIKLDSAGNVQWYEFQYPGIAKETSDHGYIIVAPNGETEGRLVKLTETGQLQWSIGFRDTSKFRVQIYARFVEEASDGSFYIGGNTLWDSSVTDLYSLFIAKLSPTGSLLWNKKYSLDGDTGVYLWQMIRTSDNGFAMGATTINQRTGNFLDLLILKFDSVGTIQWTQLTDLILDRQIGTAIIEDTGAVILVLSGSQTATTGQMVITGVDLEGRLKSARLLSSSYACNPFGITLNKMGVPVIAGSMGQLFKFDGEMFVMTLDNQQPCHFRDILVLTDELRLTVSSPFINGPVSSREPTTLNFDIVSGATEFDFCSYISVHSEPTLGYSAISLSPNPVREDQVIQINLSGNSLYGSYLIVLRDALGKEVIHENRQFSGSEKKVAIQTTALPNGIYSVELLDPNNFASVWHGKVVKVK